MRQLVSVVTDEHVRYFVTDEGEEIEQIAQLVNRGLDVEAVVQLGTSLSDVLRLNGHKRKAVKPAAVVPELPPAPAPRRRVRSYHDLTRGEVIDYITAHPGCRAREMADVLLPGIGKLGRHTVSNRLIAILATAKNSGEEAPIYKVLSGHEVRAMPCPRSWLTWRSTACSASSLHP
jgi:hypothetical protein